MRKNNSTKMPIRGTEGGKAQTCFVESQKSDLFYLLLFVSNQKKEVTNCTLEDISGGVIHAPGTYNDFTMVVLRAA